MAVNISLALARGIKNNMALVMDISLNLTMILNIKEDMALTMDMKISISMVKAMENIKVKAKAMEGTVTGEQSMWQALWKLVPHLLHRPKRTQEGQHLSLSYPRQV